MQLLLKRWPVVSFAAVVWARHATLPPRDFIESSFLSRATVTYVRKHENMLWVALAQDGTSCKISREVTKRQVNKVKTMYIYLL